VSENRVLRRISSPERDEMARGWRKLHNGELHNFYSSLSIIRKIKPRRTRWEDHVARMKRKTNAHKALVGKPQGKRSVGRPRHR
jgi:hypothetical protein